MALTTRKRKPRKPSRRLVREREMASRAPPQTAEQRAKQVPPRPIEKPAVPSIPTSEMYFDRHQKTRDEAEARTIECFKHKKVFNDLSHERKVSRYLNFLMFSDHCDVTDEALHFMRLSHDFFNHYIVSRPSTYKELVQCTRPGCSNMTRSLSRVCNAHPCIVFDCGQVQRTHGFCAKHYTFYFRLKHK